METISITEQQFHDLLYEECARTESGNGAMEFEFVDKISKGCDLEKGYEHFIIIIQRLSDGKFFKGKYSECSDHFEYKNDLTFKEVKRVEFIAYKYE